MEELYQTMMIDGPDLSMRTKAAERQLKSSSCAETIDRNFNVSPSSYYSYSYPPHGLLAHSTSKTTASPPTPLHTTTSATTTTTTIKAYQDHFSKFSIFLNYLLLFFFLFFYKQTKTNSHAHKQDNLSLCFFYYYVLLNLMCFFFYLMF